MQMLSHFRWLVRLGNFGTPAGTHLHEVARRHIGEDVAPLYDELGCAEAVSHILDFAFADPGIGSISTAELYGQLKRSEKFVAVTSPISGDIIISPTGFGKVGKIGHTGIVTDHAAILSNNSQTALWSPHWTIPAWLRWYRDKNAFPVFYFRRLIY